MHVAGGNVRQNPTPVNPGNALKRYIRPAVRSLGIKIGGWHDFSHTLGTTLRKHVWSAKVTADILGHSSLQVTDGAYDHADHHDFRDALGGIASELLRDITKPQIGKILKTKDLVPAVGFEITVNLQIDRVYAALRTPTSLQSLLNITVLAAGEIEFAVNLISPADSVALLPTQHPKTPTEGRVLWPQCGHFPRTRQMITLQRRLLT